MQNTEKQIGGVRYRVVLWKCGMRQVYGKNYHKTEAEHIAALHRANCYWDEVSVEID